MISVIVICPEESLRAPVRSLVTDSQQVTVRRELRHLPGTAELLEITQAPVDLLLISADDPHTEPALSVLRRKRPKLPVVTVSSTASPEQLLRLMRAGICDHLTLPFTDGEMPRLIGRLRMRGHLEMRTAAPFGDLLAFLPAKAGAGTSLVAANVSIALSRLPRRRTLLMDGDTTAGLVRFLLNLQSEHSLGAAVEQASDLDDALWPKLVAHFGNLDVLPSPLMRTAPPPHPLLLQQMLQFARGRYRTLCTDLSGLMDRHSTEFLTAAKRIVLVCTAELPSLYLASQKFLMLQELDLGPRVCLVVNRATQEQVLADAQIQQIVGAPVYCTLSEDLEAVHESLRVAREVRATSVLGGQLTALAHRLVNINSNRLAAGAQEQVAWAPAGR